MDSEKSLCQIKFVVDPEVHRIVRLAAASRGEAMSEFCRMTVIAAANAELKQLGLPVSRNSGGSLREDRPRLAGKPAKVKPRGKRP